MNLTPSPVDRNAHLRLDVHALKEISDQARYIIQVNDRWITQENSHLVNLHIFNHSQVGAITASLMQDDFLNIYLGQNEGVHYFSLNFPDEKALSHISAATKCELSSNVSLREVAHELPILEYHLAIHSQAIAHWHRSHIHCPRCGSLTYPDFAGSIRRCPIDNTEHYPRTDPAIITILRDENDRILLGRQSKWDAGRYSTFAGFVEAGESFEEAVMREVHEEAGVRVNNIKYLASQPWPYPSSLMIAFEAIVINPESAQADGEEIESLRWYTRENMSKDLSVGALTLPPSMSVSRKMIEAWYGQPL